MGEIYGLFECGSVFGVEIGELDGLMSGAHEWRGVSFLIRKWRVSFKNLRVFFRKEREKWRFSMIPRENQKAAVYLLGELKTDGGADWVTHWLLTWPLAALLSQC
ncbi:hypothetical protein COLO4_32958 [Corchorus olitorius]|uniref:Uncharacterized protein n=1 Tax=Corchorus olitorius TaxID=93759 RepID=A0A1R3GX30_9ROSI|nr:hypothetical protein COLO4_32958 [Corchorus olitorius]